jgi:hypothetical protein
MDDYAAPPSCWRYGYRHWLVRVVKSRKVVQEYILTAQLNLL